MTTLALRPYRPHDARSTAEVYQAAIRVTAAQHYDHDQVEAWAGTEIDLGRWNHNRSAVWTVVAQQDGSIVGFADPTVGGELDMLFVHPKAGGTGVARQLVAAILAEARRREFPFIRTHASRAARPALERLGFVVDAENLGNTVRGVAVPNFDMHIDL